MKRLTRRLLNRTADCAYCTYEFDDNGLCKNNCSLRRQQLERLAAYEDAEEQGLLVQLPCKVGDTVYAVVQCANIMMHHDNDYLTGTGAVECPFEGSCEFYECNDEQSQLLETVVTGWWLQGDEKYETPELFLEYVQKSYYLRDFGKTVFLTRSEAEAALKGEGKRETN